MRTADFEFELPPELIAQHPAPQRDGSRLLVLNRENQELEHHHFPALLAHLKSGDVLVLNNSRVIPARLRATNAATRGNFEILLLEEVTNNDWWTMMKPGKRAPIGTKIIIKNHVAAETNITATIIATNAEGHRRLHFNGTADIAKDLEMFGEIPLPPYIRRAPTTAAGQLSMTGSSSPDTLDAEDRERYQTVYAHQSGSVAAPTAGLHFTPEILAQARALGVEICFVTLHVGLGTFAPVKSETLAEHIMHEERFEISAAAADTVNTAKQSGRRVIAVGTTSVRVLESAAVGGTNEIRAGEGRTRIFIHPPYQFKIVDALLTNFHLPCSTLLMLVSAFASPGNASGRDLILKAYAAAVQERYRFFSYGDAMLII